jgi:hypothetical protein
MNGVLDVCRNPEKGPDTTRGGGGARASLSGGNETPLDTLKRQSDGLAWSVKSKPANERTPEPANEQERSSPATLALSTAVHDAGFGNWMVMPPPTARRT